MAETSENQPIEGPISPERWNKLETVFDAALAFGPSDREDFLKQACLGDEGLQREVESLLVADEGGDDFFLNNGAFELCMKIMAEETIKDEVGSTVAFESEISPGMILNDHWQILEPLNAGGMAEVYKARDLRFPTRVVVVKVLKKESQQNPWKVKKFGHEGHGQSRIQHPNVATVFDKGTLPNREEYLVMEFIEGSTLRQVMKAHKDNDEQIDFSLVAEIMRQVGRGVDAIHKAGLVHRDLKPENIMVQNNADEPVVKIIDFGIVRVLDMSTVWGQVVGTPFYMSPEQFRGEDPTFTNDIYALGVIAYELLTGRRPFEPQNATPLRELQKQGLRVKPSTLRDGLPPAAERMIIKALSYEANKRPSLARQFTDQLARTLSEVQPPKSWWHSTTVRIAAAVLLAALLGTMVWTFLPFVRPQHSSATLDPIVPAALRPERTLRYSLSIMRKRDGKTAPATGRETFDTGDEFRIAFTPSQTGALYLFNQGTSGNWHLLFPTRKNHEESPQLAAFERVETDGYEFTNQSGSEKGIERVWVVWAAAPVPELNEAVKQALQSELTISTSARRSFLQEFMTKHQSPEDVQIDKERSQVALKGRSEVWVYLMELESKDWK